MVSQDYQAGLSIVMHFLFFFFSLLSTVTFLFVLFYDPWS